MSKEQIFAFGKKNKGSILAYSLIILSVMMAIVTSLSVSTIITKKSASGTEFSVQSLQTADGGVQTALKKINAELTLPTPRSLAAVFTNCGSVVADKVVEAGPSGSSYELSFLKLDGMPARCVDVVSNVGTIKSIGTYKNTVRAVDVVVAGVNCRNEVNDRNFATNSIKYKEVKAKDGKCWLDRNLGAITYPTSITALNDSNGYGWLFQWGRSADGHQIVSPAKSGEVPGPSSLVVPGDKFLTFTGFNGWAWYNGVSPAMDTFWQGADGTNNNPCPTGFRVPKQSEWLGLIAATAENITNNATAFTSSIKLTAPGWRQYDGTGPLNVGNYGYYWASDLPNKYGLYISNTGVNYNVTSTQAVGYSVRCIKN